MIAACPNVEDVVAESLVEWDGLKSRIYRCCLHNSKYSHCSYYILVALILFLQSSS